MSISKRRDDMVVFRVRRDTECAECGAELWQGSLIRLEDRVRSDVQDVLDKWSVTDD